MNDDPKLSVPTDSAEEPEADVNRARRKLLAALVYAAPLVVSAVAVQPAHGQELSCGPNTCKPLGGDLCGPIACPPRGGCTPGPCPPRL